MESLSEQYAIEVKKIDRIIWQRLKKALQVEFRVKGEEIAEKQLYDRIESRREAILSLFDGNFSENEDLLRGRMEQHGLPKRKHRIDPYSQCANAMIRTRVDATIDELIGEDKDSAMMTSVGIERKTFIDAVLDGNIDIDLQRDKKVNEEYAER